MRPIWGNVRGYQQWRVFKFCHIFYLLGPSPSQLQGCCCCLKERMLRCMSHEAARFLLAQPGYHDDGQIPVCERLR